MELRVSAFDIVSRRKEEACFCRSRYMHVRYVRPVYGAGGA